MRKFKREAPVQDLMALPSPRSSGGSFRSFIASETVAKRWDIFFRWDFEDDEETGEEDIAADSDDAGSGSVQEKYHIIWRWTRKASGDLWTRRGAVRAPAIVVGRRRSRFPARLETLPSYLTRSALRAATHGTATRVLYGQEADTSPSCGRRGKFRIL